MSLDFLNPLMLVGLAGLSLPFLAHLLSKKKYDIVHWGAMQFLELAPNARRKIRLEQLLLMLLRMGLIALVVLALSRPWASGGFLANLVSTQSRDVVFVIDGSYSMGWEGKTRTPHAAARQWVHAFLEELNAGDTVSVIDARDQARLLTESPTQDFGHVRELVDELPPPSGSSNLAEACAQAVGILSRTSNLARDVIVLSDGQARGWSADDENLWMLFDDRMKEPGVRPRVWVLDVANHESEKRPNFAVDRLQLSRELSVVDSPVRIRTKVMYSGGTATVTRQVHLEVDGQRLADKTLSLQLQPQGEASVEFEYRPKSTGSHVVSVVLDEDNLPGDNRADAAVNITEALPVLLVNGEPNSDPVRRETFFASAALSASSNESPWVQADVVDFDKLDPGTLGGYEVVVLANVPRLSEAQATALAEYVARGGTLLAALGEHVDADNYNRLLFGEGDGLLPARLDSIQQDPIADSPGVRVLGRSLELPWVRPFNVENGIDFLQTRFEKWWKVEPASRGRKPAGANPEAHASRSPNPDASGSAEEATAPPQVSAAAVIMRLDTQSEAPLLLGRHYGRGAVLLFTSALDRDWSTLPTQRDYVPFLHESIFYLAAQKSSRNVEVGMPLVLPVAEDFPFGQYAFYGPGETVFPAEAHGRRPVGSDKPVGWRVVRLSDTRLPGIYELKRKRATGSTRTGSEANRAGVEHFVVNFDRGESDLSLLDDGARAGLSNKGERMQFVGGRDELKAGMFTDDSRAELWYILLFLFLGILVFELVMTRKLVQGGHADVEDVPLEAI